jgi:hypothetical protein
LRKIVGFVWPISIVWGVVGEVNCRPFGVVTPPGSLPDEVLGLPPPQPTVARDKNTQSIESGTLLITAETLPDGSIAKRRAWD